MKTIRFFTVWIIALFAITVTNPAWAADKTKPTPGIYALGYPKAVGTSIELIWTRARDNVTAQDNLRYRVVWKKKSGGSWKNSHSKPFTNYPKDLTKYTITGLEPNTKYVVDVEVYDEAENYQFYGERTVKTGADTQKPTPGGYQSGYPKATGPTTIKVRWNRATDDVTTQANLRYVVIWKKKSESGWHYSHPWPVTNFPKDWTSYTITGLKPNTEYEVDVEVWDEAKNFEFYGEKIVKTEAADTEKPKAGCNGKITIGTVTTNSIALSWCAATDNVTPHSRMKYTYTYEEASSYDGSFPMANDKYGTGITSGTITGLKPGTKYKVWVYATDEAGNYNFGSNTDHIKYHPVNVETKPAADTQRPTAGGYESGYPKATGPTTIEVKWKRAIDNVTATANLRYRVLWKKKSESGWQASHSGPATSFPKDWTSYTITGLSPNTEYIVDVEVVDEAGNWKFYGQKTVKTKADTEKPKAGCNGKITIGTVTTNSIALSWCAATDNVTPHSRMKYTYTYAEGFHVVSFPMANDKYGTGITSGTITGLKPGTKYTVWVYATDEAGNYNFGSNTGHIKYHPVNVETKPAAIAVTGVTLSPASLNLEVGQTGGLTATVAPATATNKAVTWSSSNTAIATVDGSGTVKGIAPGTATITVKTDQGGKTATATVTVKEATAPAVKVTSVTLNRNSVTINGDYEEVQLTATVAPATATDQSLTWSSNNPQVASVDATGLVTIHKKGKAKITVKANDGSGRYDTCDFDVIQTVGNETVDGLRVYAHGGALHLTLPNAATVHIYNVNGAIVKTLFLPAGDHVQPLPSGVYLVRVGERVRKILVK